MGSECVRAASIWAQACVDWERKRGAVDPIGSIARRVKASKYAIWALLYRPPKHVYADIYFALETIYEQQCLKQAEIYRRERASAEAQTNLGAALLRAADCLAGQDSGGLNVHPHRKSDKLGS